MLSNAYASLCWGEDGNGHQSGLFPGQEQWGPEPQDLLLARAEASLTRSSLHSVLRVTQKVVQLLPCVA